MSYDLFLIRPEYLDSANADLSATISRPEAEAALSETANIRQIEPGKYRYTEGDSVSVEISLAESGNESALKSVVFRFSYGRSQESCRLHVEAAYRLAFTLGGKLGLGIYDPQIGGFVEEQALDCACGQALEKADQARSRREAVEEPPPGTLWDRLKGLFAGG
ncbi:MAG: hypothetical protein IT210_05800 [Armatimonadetes bacterium]|nr:hypothetical protein [Armatimonadota bacterium]